MAENEAFVAAPAIIVGVHVLVAPSVVDELL
jgi:hypothetical protein